MSPNEGSFPQWFIQIFTNLNFVHAQSKSVRHDKNFFLTVLNGVLFWIAIQFWHSSKWSCCLFPFFFVCCRCCSCCYCCFFLFFCRRAKTDVSNYIFLFVVLCWVCRQIQIHIICCLMATANQIIHVTRNFPLIKLLHIWSICHRRKSKW